MRLTVQGHYTDFGFMSLGLNVRFGSEADICGAKAHVRFTPNSDRESGHGSNRETYGCTRLEKRKQQRARRCCEGHIFQTAPAPR